MYKEFDGYLDSFAKMPGINDSWFDDGCVIATEMLQEFTADDWRKLTNSILSKSVMWQTLYAYCVDSDINDEAIIKSLVILCGIDDDELFVTCIDSLRCIINQNNIRIIANDRFLAQKLEKLLPKCGIVTKKIIEEFIDKLNNYSGILDE
ncbi:hypothetical protein [Abyssisolibacter fermentans]|uniref:hypothetical protein n=1 Tax=Abyssisolibacter fermentans TaxID=1766203 RepID=UPI00192E5E98|nr:hypothetical protein [Abyssisolibacter fermentans]